MGIPNCTPILKLGYIVEEVCTHLDVHGLHVDGKSKVSSVHRRRGAERERERE